MRKEGGLQGWGQQMTENTQKYFVGLKKIIKESIEAVENRCVKDFEQNCQLNEEPLKQIQDQFEQTYPIKKMK